MKSVAYVFANCLFTNLIYEFNNLIQFIPCAIDLGILSILLFAL